jgi:hypothetical protein
MSENASVKTIPDAGGEAPPAPPDEAVSRAPVSSAPSLNQRTANKLQLRHRRPRTKHLTRDHGVAGVASIVSIARSVRVIVGYENARSDAGYGAFRKGNRCVVASLSHRSRDQAVRFIIPRSLELRMSLSGKPSEGVTVLSRLLSRGLGSGQAVKHTRSQAPPLSAPWPANSMRADLESRARHRCESGVRRCAIATTASGSSTRINSGARRQLS